MVIEKGHIQALLDNMAIVLVKPKYPENIGAAARIAANMGFGRLILVSPCLPELARMQKMATHHAAHLLEKMEVYETLAEAVSTFSWVVGTSARRGRRRSLYNSPRQTGREIIELLKHNRVAMVFGPEDRGLRNDELQYCNQISTIPTTDFSSLNLAQAVAIHCYEVHFAILEKIEKGSPAFAPKRVEGKEMEATYGQLEKVLRRFGLLKESDYDYWMSNIRLFLGRIGLRAKEAKIIRGVCRQLLRYDPQPGPDKPAKEKTGAKAC